MKTPSILLIVSLVIAIACLGAGYLFAGYWQIVPVLLVVVFFWIFTRKRPSRGPAAIMLFSIVALAAIGVLTGLSLLLMLAACTAALAAWDLMLFARWQVTEARSASTAKLERIHLQSLALAAAAGLLLAWASSSINLSLPLIVVILLGFLATAGLVYGIKARSG